MYSRDAVPRSRRGRAVSFLSSNEGSSRFDHRRATTEKRSERKLDYMRHGVKCVKGSEHELCLRSSAGSQRGSEMKLMDDARITRSPRWMRAVDCGEPTRC